MEDINKKELSETDICDLFISPAIKDAGWDPMTQIRREVTLTPGPIIVRGNVSSRNKKKKKFADYVLSYQPGIPIAVVEAKDNKEGKIKKQKPLPEIGEDEKPFDLPNGWRWAFIPQVVANDKYAIKRGPFGSSIRKDFFYCHKIQLD